VFRADCQSARRLPSCPTLFSEASVSQAYDVNLWENSADEAVPATIVAPINPADVDLDPLSFL